MPVYLLDERPVLPNPRLARADGLLAIGGDLSSARLLAGYSHGIFPWPDGESELLLWWSPPARAVFLPGDEHFSRSTRKALRRKGFQVRCDTCFGEVIRHCQQVPREDQGGTWITDGMIEAYEELHRLGYAHSFETFSHGELVGGLYGVSLGAAFFGESMFHLESYASRAAFAALCDTLWAQGFQFVDGQVPNSNLDQLGARTVARSKFLGMLERAQREPTRRGRWTGCTEGRQLPGSER